jgi:hypothetical protein
LPAAGFDDCEHRFIPSCSIPASERVRAGFFFSRYGFTATIGTVANFRAIGERSLKSAQKQAARGISRAGWGTYSREVPRVKENRPENRPNLRDSAHFWSPPAHPDQAILPNETNGFPRRCPGNFHRARAKWLTM